MEVEILLHVIKSADIDVEANDEKEVNVEFGEEEILGIAIPFEVYNHLDSFLLEQVEVFRLHQSLDQLDFVFTLDFHHVEVIELHLMLLLLILCIFLFLI